MRPELARIWSNYLATLRNERVLSRQYERGEVGYSRVKAAVEQTEALAGRMDYCILTDSTDDLAELLWNLGETASKISGGSISRKKLTPDDPFLTLMQRFRVIAQLYRENNLGKRRIRGIVLRMQERRVNELADAIGNAVERFTRIVRI